MITGGQVAIVGSQGGCVGLVTGGCRALVDNGCVGLVTGGCRALVAEDNVVGVVGLFGSVDDVDELSEADVDGFIEVSDVDKAEGLSIEVDAASSPLVSSFSLDVL